MDIDKLGAIQARSAIALHEDGAEADEIYASAMDVPDLVAGVKHAWARVEDLEGDSKFLGALEAAGVDNWEGYEIAQEMGDD